MSTEQAVQAEAGATGTAITLVDVIQKMELERIASRFKITFEELKDPTDEDVTNIIGERVTAMLEKEFRKRTNIQQERIARFLPVAKKYAEDEEALALLAMLLDDIYQPSLHGKPAEPTAQQPRQQKQAKPKQPERNRKPQQKRSPKPQEDSQERTQEKRQPKPDRPKKKRPQKPADTPHKKPVESAPEAEGDTRKPKPRRRRRRRKRKPSGS